MNRGVVLLRLGAFEEAEREMQIALRNVRGADAATVLDQLAVLERERGRYSKAESFYREAIDRRSALFARDPKLWGPRIRVSYSGLADALLRQGRDTEAFEAYARALGVSESVDHEQMAATHRSFARTLHGVGQHSESIDYYERSLAVRDLDPQHLRFDVLTVLDGYAQVLDAADRPRDANKVRERSWAALAGTHYLDHVFLPGGYVARWADSQMPIEVVIRKPGYKEVRDSEAAPLIAREAVLAWKDSVRPGIPSFEFVKNSRSGITIDWDHDTVGTGWLGLCPRFGGKTRIALISRVSWHHLPDDLLLAVALHEVGHSLGLGHSPYPGDVMYASITDKLVMRPSLRDIETLRLLYALPPGWQ